MSDYEDSSGVQHPGSFTVESSERQPVLYLADGTALTRDARIGFRTAPAVRKRGGKAAKVGPPDR